MNNLALTICIICSSFLSGFYCNKMLSKNYLIAPEVEFFPDDNIKFVPNWKIVILRDDKKAQVFLYLDGNYIATIINWNKK